MTFIEIFTVITIPSLVFILTYFFVSDFIKKKRKEQLQQIKETINESEIKENIYKAYLEIRYTDGRTVTLSIEEKDKEIVLTAFSSIFYNVINWFANQQRRYYTYCYKEGETVLDRNYIISIDRKVEGFEESIWDLDQK